MQEIWYKTLKLRNAALTKLSSAQMPGSPVRPPLIIYHDPLDQSVLYVLWKSRSRYFLSDAHP